jgi:hypothetical protein
MWQKGFKQKISQRLCVSAVKSGVVSISSSPALKPTPKSGQICFYQAVED